MYKGKDSEELYNSITDIEEAIFHLRQARELVEGSVIEAKNCVIEEINDMINDLADELPEIQESYTDACKAEEQAETRDYYSAVAPSYWDRVIC